MLVTIASYVITNQHLESNYVAIAGTVIVEKKLCS